MQRLIDWTASAFLHLGEMLVRGLPPAGALHLADLLGTVWYLVDGRRRRRASENLRIAFGDELAPSAQRALIRSVFRNMARVPFEGLFLPRLLGSRRAFERRCRLLGDVEQLRAHLDQQRPSVMVTGHLGNWEIAAHTVRLYPAPFAAVVRTIDNRHINRHVLRNRGGRRIVIGRRGALRTVVGALRRGTWVGFVADQNAGNTGEYVPFFGLPASTHGAPAWIACRASVPFFVGACMRRPHGVMAYDCHIRMLEHPLGQDADRADIRDLIARSMAQLEAWIRLDPAQYNWLHRRWKDRPEDEIPGPHLPRYDHHRPRLPS